MANENFSAEQAEAYMRGLLPSLDYWKHYDRLSDKGEFDRFKKKLIEEINALNIEGMPKLESLNALVGSYVNLEYPLPSGMKVKFLNDKVTYLGNQLESELEEDHCFGVVANADFIMVASYEKEGKNPQLVIYKKR